MGFWDRITGKEESTWHPASGQYGWFGETKGKKQADRAKAEIDRLIQTIEGRRPQIQEYYGEIGAMTERQNELKNLTELDKFLDTSYNLERESEKKIAKTNLATITDVDGERKKELFQDQRKRDIELANITQDMQRINLGQQEKTDLYQLDNLINQLNVERSRY